MTNYIVALLIALPLTGCMAATPTQVATKSTGEEFLAWYCYGKVWEVDDGDSNHDFYAFANSEEAFVNVHGVDMPAKFRMDGLDAHYYFGPDADTSRFDYLLIVEPDGDAKYGDWVSGRFDFSNLYYCRKAANSR